MYKYKSWLPQVLGSSALHKTSSYILLQMQLLSDESTAAARGIYVRIEAKAHRTW